jgi:hypothetical protein
VEEAEEEAGLMAEKYAEAAVVARSVVGTATGSHRRGIIV